MCNTLSPLTNPPVDSKLESCHSSIARIYLSEERVARNRTPPSRTGTRIKPKRGSSSFVKHPSAKQTAGIARIISPPRNPPPPPPRSRSGAEEDQGKREKKSGGILFGQPSICTERRGGRPWWEPIHQMRREEKQQVGPAGAEDSFCRGHRRNVAPFLARRSYSCESVSSVAAINMCKRR